MCVFFEVGNGERVDRYSQIFIFLREIGYFYLVLILVIVWVFQENDKIIFDRVQMSQINRQLVMGKKYILFEDFLSSGRFGVWGIIFFFIIFYIIWQDRVWK